MKAARWVIGLVAVALAIFAFVYFATPVDTLKPIRSYALGETREYISYPVPASQGSGHVWLRHRSVKCDLTLREVVKRLELAHPYSKGWMWGMGDGFYQGESEAARIMVMEYSGSVGKMDVVVDEFVQVNGFQLWWARLTEPHRTESAVVP